MYALLKRAFLFISIVLLFLSGSAFAERLIAPGDQLEVTVWSDKELSRTVTVSADGKITMPLIGSIKVAGSNEDAAAKLIAGVLVHYIIDPKVSVGIVKARPDRVFVLGRVKSPGVYDIQRGSTVLEGISQAGGLLDKADLDHGTVIRAGNKSEPVNLKALLAGGQMQENVQINDGDVIIVPERADNSVYVLGKVSNPGLYQLEDSVTVMGAIARSGGSTNRANLKRVTVIRGDLAKPERMEINVQDIIQRGDKSKDIILKAGDTVYVPELGAIDWDKMLQRVWMFNELKDIWK
ncbi:MAG: SLBB domain-containing protein [bacterium]|nr:SLBB domain-containing protein [bacterium]